MNIGRGRTVAVRRAPLRAYAPGLTECINRRIIPSVVSGVEDEHILQTWVGGDVPTRDL